MLPVYLNTRSCGCHCIGKVPLTVGVPAIVKVLALKLPDTPAGNCSSVPPPLIL
jgi:hypothetical protein